MEGFLALKSKQKSGEHRIGVLYLKPLILLPGQFIQRCNPDMNRDVCHVIRRMSRDPVCPLTYFAMSYINVIRGFNVPASAATHNNRQ